MERCRHVTRTVTRLDCVSQSERRVRSNTESRYGVTSPVWIGRVRSIKLQREDRPATISVDAKEIR